MPIRSPASGRLPTGPSLVAVPRTADLPLSFAQQRLWFLQRLEPLNPVYNTPSARRLVGRLDVAALEKALREIVRRHEVLRTRFPAADGRPRLVIAPAAAAPLSLGHVDLTALPEGARRDEARRRLAAEARRPFELERELPLRLVLTRLGNGEHVLFVNVHQIAADGWSRGILDRELSVLYESFAAGGSSPLPEPAIQYADFAVWQREWLSGEALDAQLAYWRRQLAELPTLELPTDRPRPAVRTYRGATTTLWLSQELTRALRRLSLDAGVPLPMSLLAAFMTLLHRLTGQEEIVVGMPVANRRRREIEDLIGFFVNTLVIRGDLRRGTAHRGPTFREFLNRVRETSLAADDHQDLPFEKLVEEIDPQHAPGDTPLFQVMFDVENTPLTPMTMQGIEISSADLDPSDTYFDLVVSLHETEETIGVDFHYKTGLFHGTTILRLRQQYETLLADVARDLTRSLKDLPLHSSAQRQQSLLEWNDTRTSYPNESSVHRLFEVQVARTPEAVAIVFDKEGGEGERYSYLELDRRANQLARQLRFLGTGPEVPVGIFLHPSPQVVICQLAILKAGGAYVPLDPAYPQERLAFIVEDAGIDVILTREELRGRLPAGSVRAVCLTRDAGALAEESSEPPRVRVGAESLAYLMYTSGSTGRPKAVSVTHRGVVRLICGNDYTRFGVNEVFLQQSPVSFDASTFEIWGALLHGGQLVIAPSRSFSLAGLGALLERYRVTVLFLTTGLFHLTVDERPEILRGLRQLLAGGDVLSLPHVRTFLRESAGTRLTICYGPTENTTFTSCWPARELPPASRSVPIGRPIKNTSFYVVGSSARLLPIRVAGELWIGGDGLGRGYLNRPALCAERFVPNPFADTPGQRLYRSGDRACYLEDGNVEFLGRIDTQVKILGFRVEPGETESVLATHPGVRQAVVVGRSCRSSEGREELSLVGYFVPHHAEGVTPSELRTFLAERLPDYMVPGYWKALDSVPLSPTGKVDRRALPEPDVVRREPESGFASPRAWAPRTASEEILAGIWEQVLQIEGIGVHDHFFELGGHSLRAAQVVSRVWDAFEIELPVRSLFEKPTLAELAEQIDQARRSAREGDVRAPALKPLPRDMEIPLSFAQQRLWFLQQLEPASAAYNLPGARRLQGPLDAAALERALGEILRRHEVLRTTFPQTDGRPRQEIAPADRFWLPRIELGALPACERRSEARRQLAVEAARPFDLAWERPLRALLLGLAEDDHLLFVNTHHIASDGWSQGIFDRELSLLYEAFSQGRSSPLPELALQYADFALWQRDYLRGRVLEERLAWWQAQLAGAPRQLDLLTDRPRPAVAGHKGAACTRALPVELSEALRALGRREGTTLFMTLLAALAVQLQRLSGQDVLVVGTPVVHRDRLKLEPLIGLFLSTLALRCDLSGDPSFLELLRRVREGVLGARDHQDLPFERLVEEVQPERDLSRHPLFQVFFNLLNFATDDPEPPSDAGLRLEPLAFGRTESKFDLTLYTAERGGQIHLRLVYRTDLFDGVRMLRWLSSFRRLLEEVVADATVSLSRLPFLSTAEAHQVLVEWSGAPPWKTSDPDRSVRRLFEAQVERMPDAVAVVFARERLTYRELNRRANRLARTLRRHGVGPETLVGLCLERSFEMVVAPLAVWKAGGAYLPLDPGYPAARLAQTVAQTRPVLVLSQEPLASGLLGDGVRSLVLDPAKRLVTSEDDENLAGEPAPQQVAYAISTSGSTGEPKGVLVTQGSLETYLRFVVRLHGLTPADAVLQLASFSFDISVRELLAPLLAGARVVLVSRQEAQDPASLLAALRRHRVTALCGLVPSLLRPLLDQAAEISPEAFGHLRLVATGGEPLPLASAWRVREIFGPQVRSVSQYGPTECTGTAASWEVSRSSFGEEIAPLGRPHPHPGIFVVDRRLRPVPIGAPGEIVIGGDGVARGYLHRPAWTAERFVPHTFTSEPGARLYKTGDRASYHPDGQVKFLGRIDLQLKIRGFRIEPGEIETVLGRHPGVKEVAVVARRAPGAGQGRHLVAFLVTPKDAAPSTGELRRFLARQLPAYLVPSFFVRLESLPRTPNRKLDRRALPELDPSRPELDTRLVAPRSKIEEILAGIWQEVLGIAEIGVEDDFFVLGGHSLLAIQVISRVREAFGIELPVRSLFEKPTLAELAKQIDELRRSPSPVAAGASAERGSFATAPDDHRPAAIALSQWRFWQRPSVRGCVTLRLRGSLDTPALERALGEIVRRHQILRSRFFTRDDQPLQQALPYRPWTLHTVDLRRCTAQRYREYERMLEAFPPKGPFFRARLLRLHAGEYWLLLTLHHIVTDGWSGSLLKRELLTLYRAFSQGQLAPLAEPPVQYADFARRYEASAAVRQRREAAVTYWRQRLRDLPRLRLPSAAPAAADPPWIDEVVLVPEALGRGLKALARAEEASLQMVLLACYQALLHRLTGSTDVVVKTPFNGRDHAELNAVIGCFARDLAVRTDLSGNPSLREVLRRVRDRTFEAYNHSEVCLATQAAELGAPGGFQFPFNFRMNQEQEPLPQPPGLEVVPITPRLDISHLALGSPMSDRRITLSAWTQRDVVKLGLTCRRRFFDPRHVQQLAAHLELLIAAMAGDPDRPLSSVPTTSNRLSKSSRRADSRAPADFSAPSKGK